MKKFLSGERYLNGEIVQPERYVNGVLVREDKDS
jgi:hypothetical protein